MFSAVVGRVRVRDLFSSIKGLLHMRINAAVVYVCQSGCGVLTLSQLCSYGLTFYWFFTKNFADSHLESVWKIFNANDTIKMQLYPFLFELSLLMSLI